MSYAFSVSRVSRSGVDGVGGAHHHALNELLCNFLSYIVDSTAPRAAVAHGGAVLLQPLRVPVKDLEGAERVRIEGARGGRGEASGNADAVGPSCRR